jgi:hypothetical protein
MTGPELRALRAQLPKPTSASEIARRLGYTRQWIAWQERRRDQVPDSIARPYAGVIEQLRAEQAGRETQTVDVAIAAMIGDADDYMDALDSAREWIRTHPDARRIAFVDVSGSIAFAAALDALDRAGVVVSFRMSDGRRILRSKA